jgi:WD40 repeat protein
VNASELLSDLLRLLPGYPIIAVHALHVYYSAMVTMPSCSLFRTWDTLHHNKSWPQLVSARLSGWQSLQSIMEGHTEQVIALARSPEGRSLASGSHDHTVRLWNPQTGEMIAVLKGHTNLVSIIVYSPDGRYIASGSDDHTVRVWDFESRSVHAICEGHTDSVSSLVFSPDGNRVASASYDCTIRFWSAHTGQIITVLHSHSKPVCTVCFSPDGRYLATGSKDCTVKLWNMFNEQNIGIRNTLVGHTGPVWTVAFSSDVPFVYGMRKPHRYALFWLIMTTK